MSEQKLENQPAAQPEAAVPEKFKNPETGAVNLGDLIKSYLSLEKKLGEKTAARPVLPASPQEYNIALKSELLENDPDINQRLFDLGFTNDQVQAVYDLAAEKIVPVLQQVAVEYKTAGELKALSDAFGGADKFNAVARQISAWAEKNLDKNLFDVLASSKDGILTLYNMMTGRQEVAVLPPSGKQVDADSEESLRKLMQDPKYWKDQDPALTKRVEEGFRRLYG